MKTMSKKKTSRQNQSPKSAAEQMTEGGTDQGAEESSSKPADRHAVNRQVRLTEENYQAMRILAQKNGRPLTWEIRMALEAWIAQNSRSEDTST